jgi:hypothetical protein
MTWREIGRWLFHTPARLLAATMVVVLASGLTLWAADAVTGSTDDPRGAAAADHEAAAGSDAAHPAGRDMSATRRPEAVPARARVQRTVYGYLRVFLSDTGTRTAWQARLDRLSTGTLARLNATVPRASVPHATLRRLTLTALSSSYASTQAVLSDGTQLRVALVLEPDGWKVTEVAPEPAR